MFRDTRNINVKVLSWLLLAITLANLHYVCTFLYVDVLHLNKNFIFEFRNISFNLYWRDVFLFYDAPKEVCLDIQYYFFLLGDRCRDAIIAYLLYSAIVALSTYWHTIHRHSKIYHRIQLFAKVYVFVQIYSLINYILCMGQFMHGLPILIYTICVLFIFFIRLKDGRIVIKPEL